MTKKNPTEEEVELNMTPMIDVTFQLLIFFIITLKFKTLEKKLNSYLPTDFGKEAGAPIDDVFLAISLRQARESSEKLMDRDTTARIGDETLSLTQDSDAFRILKRKLRQFREHQKDAIGKIDVGLGVPHSKVISVLDLFNKTGYKTVSFTGMTSTATIAQGQKWWEQTRSQLHTP